MIIILHTDSSYRFKCKRSSELTEKELRNAIEATQGLLDTLRKKSKSVVIEEMDLPRESKEKCKNEALKKGNLLCWN